MKLLRSNPWRGNAVSRVFGALFYSTETLSSSSSSSSPHADSLYHRISRAGDPRVPIVPVLDQWLEEGRDVKQAELQKIVKQLRKFRRFKHALQMSEWMSDQMNHDLSPGDMAIRLDLISKVHGIEKAENYFDSIPETSRILHVYGSLLNCYAENKSLDKAEVIMQKMRELGFLKTSLSYNVMLNLYSRMGENKKLDILVQEMEEKGIECDSFTYNIRLNAYAAASDLEGMEKLLMKMEADPTITIDWNAYVVAANGYLRADQNEKALAMLKKSEQLIYSKRRRFAYEILLTLYAAIQNKDEVYRIWNLYRNMDKVYNSGYMSMISSLVKLDDIDGVEKILEEWESGNTFFDIRVPNLLITAYCKKGLWGKAEAYFNRLIESGKEPDPSTWDRLATGYRVDGQMGKAVDTIKKAILASQPGWKPNRYTLAACLEYLKEKGDVEVTEELLRLLEEKGHLSTGFHERLLNYINNENPTSSALDLVKGDDQMEGDDQAPSENEGVLDLKCEGSS